jgi:hypothetical protein
VGSTLALGALVGLLLAVWAVVLVSANRAKGIFGGLLTVVLVVAPIAYFWLPDDLTPKPGTVARQLGWVATVPDGVVLAITMIVVAALGYGLAAKAGVVRWLTTRMDGGQAQVKK